MEINVEGVKIFAATGGAEFDAKKPVLVLLHGAGMDHTVWAQQSRWFAHHGHAVLAVDLPGHGKSGGEAFSTMSDYADWLPKLLDAAKVEKAALAGHSLGALIALEAAARHPSQVRALTLLGAASKMPVHPDMLASAQAGTDEVIHCMTSWAHARRNHFGRHAMPGIWMIGQARRLIGRSKPGVIHAGLSACNAYKGAAEAAAKVACPALLILGSEDMMTPAKGGKELAAMIPGARAEIIQGSGHMMATESPQITLELMRTNA